MDMDIFLPLSKVDEEKRIIIARAAAEEGDRAREIMDYPTAVEAFKKWSGESKLASGGKSLGNVRVMHQPRVAGRVIDIMFNDQEKAIDVAFKVDDPALWEMCKSGAYTGLSVGGGYAKKWADPSDPTLTRYTPTLAEISIVDRPCIASATFQVMKADGTTETRHFPEERQVKRLRKQVGWRAEMGKIERRERSIFDETLMKWGAPLKKAEDGRAGRDADSDGKLNEGKDDETAAGPKAAKAGKGGSNGGVKRDATQTKPSAPDTSTKAGYQARRKSDEGYRAETTQVIPEERGKVYGGIAGGAALAIPAAALAGAQAYPIARNAAAKTVGEAFERMGGAAGAAAGRALGTFMPGSQAFRGRAIQHTESFGRVGATATMKAANWAYYGLKGKIGDAAVSAAGGRRWLAAAGLAAAAGYGAAKVGAHYGSWLGSAHDAIYPYRRVEKADGPMLFNEALASRALTFSEAVVERPVSFLEIVQEYGPLEKVFDESKVKRDEVGRFTFKDAAGIAIGVGIGAAGALAATKILGNRATRSAARGAGRYMNRLLNKTTAQVLKSVSKGATEFMNMTLAQKATTIVGGAKIASFVAGGLYLANKFIRNGDWDLDFTDQGIVGALKVPDKNGVMHEFASFNSATGVVKLPGLFPGVPGYDRASTISSQGQQQSAQSGGGQGSSTIPSASGWTPDQRNAHFASVSADVQNMDADFRPKNGNVAAGMELQGREMEKVFSDRVAGKLTGGQASRLAATIAFGANTQAHPTNEADWEKRIRSRIPPGGDDVYQTKAIYQSALNLARLAPLSNESKTSLTNAIQYKRPPKWDEDGYAADDRGARYPAIAKNSAGNTLLWASKNVISKGDSPTQTTVVPREEARREAEVNREIRKAEPAVGKGRNVIAQRAGISDDAYNALTAEERSKLYAQYAKSDLGGMLAKMPTTTSLHRFV